MFVRGNLHEGQNGNKAQDVIVFEYFTYRGKTRNKPHRVGTALPSVKGGLVVFIPPGISITGRMLIVPKKMPLDEST